MFALNVFVDVVSADYLGHPLTPPGPTTSLPLCLGFASDATTPQELLEAKVVYEKACGCQRASEGSSSAEPPVLPFSPNKVLAKGVVQLQLVEL